MYTHTYIIVRNLLFKKYLFWLVFTTVNVSIYVHYNSSVCGVDHANPSVCGVDRSLIWHRLQHSTLRHGTAYNGGGGAISEHVATFYARLTKISHTYDILRKPNLKRGHYHV